MVLSKGLRPLQVASLILFVRILSVFLVQTSFVPDEYWQTLEVAHKQAFGYGALTWEWQKGIRSYLYPSVVAVLYNALKVTGLDYPEAVVLLPRILQSLLSAVADYRFYKWTGGRKWALYLVLTSWFWFYTSSRTLLQTVEASLITIALSIFPFKDGRRGYYEKENPWWIWLAVICVFMRPTSALLWAVFVAYNLFTTNQDRLRLMLLTYIPIGLMVGGAILALDSYCYGRFIITPWEFFKFNVLENRSGLYGEVPWFFYPTEGLLTVLGVNIVPFLWSVSKIVRRPKENKVGVLFLVVIALHIIALSFIPHKEHRFLLPLMPMFLYLQQDVIVTWSRKAKLKSLDAVAVSILVGNVIMAAYTGMLHQSGTLRVMPLLRESITNTSSIAFLMPCHSTPLYSHLHMNITTRYLNCDPPSTGYSNYTPYTEVQKFYNGPLTWWEKEYRSRQTPTHLVMFDNLKSEIEPILTDYEQTHELYHCQFPLGRESEKVLLFRKREKQSSPLSDDMI